MRKEPKGFVLVTVALVLVVLPAVPATGLPSMTRFTLPEGVEVLVTVAVNVTD